MDVNTISTEDTNDDFEKDTISTGPTADLESIASFKYDYDKWSALDVISIEEKKSEEPKKIEESDQNDLEYASICRKNIEVKKSEVLRHPYFRFPIVSDLGIEHILFGGDLRTDYDRDGRVKYLEICHAQGRAPIKRIIDSLSEEEINLRYFGVDSREMRAICEALIKNAHVQTMDLTDNKLTTDACYHLQQLLMNNSLLKVLNLTRCKIGPQGARRIAEGLGLNAKLQSINLSYNELGDEGLEYIATAIGDCCACNEFNLSHNGLGSSSAKALGKSFNTNTNLIALNLSWNHLNNADTMIKFLEELSTGNKLEVIDLSWNHIKDGLSIALRKVMTIKTLKKYILNNNMLTAIGSETILSGLSKSKRLQVLNLSNNPINPNDAGRVINQLTKVRSPLTELLMSNICVKKDFLDVISKLKSSGVNVLITHGKVISNFEIEKADMKIIVLKRARFLAMSSKKKKDQKDFPALILGEISKGKEEVPIEDFDKFIRKTLKLSKLDSELLNEMAHQFVGPKKGFVSIKLMESYIKRLWPNYDLD